MIYHEMWVNLCWDKILSYSLSLSWNFYMVILVGLYLKSAWGLWFPAMLILCTSVVSWILCSRISFRSSTPKMEAAASS
jgi:hypothetical protein